MDIILLERVAKLGQIGDVVSVKNGFARNFLLPQKKALRATKANMAVFEVQRKDIEFFSRPRHVYAPPHTIFPPQAQHQLSPTSL